MVFKEEDCCTLSGAVDGEEVAWAGEMPNKREAKVASKATRENRERIQGMVQYYLERAIWKITLKFKSKNEIFYNYTKDSFHPKM
jgi:hypothetical protein